MPNLKPTPLPRASLYSVFADHEVSDLIEALQDRIKLQRAALASANEGHNPPYFRPDDFAIPRLERLLARIES